MARSATGWTLTLLAGMLLAVPATAAGSDGTAGPTCSGSFEERDFCLCGPGPDTRLGGRGGDESLDALLAGLATADAKGRQSAARALGFRRAPEAAEGLTRALDEDDAKVRQEAAWALGVIRPPGVVEALVTALRDDDSHVRQNAACALGRMEDEDLAPVLRTARDQDGNPFVRAAAQLALERLVRING